MQEIKQERNQYDTFLKLHNRVEELVRENQQLKSKIDRLESQDEVEDNVIRLEHTSSDCSEIEDTADTTEEYSGSGAVEDEDNLDDSIDEDSEDEEKQRVVCQFCNNKFNLKGFSLHLGYSHNVDLDATLTNSDGKYVCGLCGNTNHKRYALRNHMKKNHDIFFTEYLATHLDKDDLVLESEEDDEAKKKSVEGLELEEIDGEKYFKGYRIDEDYSGRVNGSYSHRKQKCVSYLFHQDSLKPINEIARDVFGISNLDNSERALIYQALERLVDEDVLKFSKDGRSKIYGLKQSSKSDIDLNPNSVELAISEIGKDNWDILIKGFFVGSGDREALVPDAEGGSSKVTYYDFEPVFGSTDEFEAIDMWEKLLSNERLQNGLKSYFDGELEIKISSNGSRGSKSKVITLRRLDG